MANIQVHSLPIELLEKIRELADGGMIPKDIAKQLNVPYRRVLAIVPDMRPVISKMGKEDYERALEFAREPGTTAHRICVKFGITYRHAQKIIRVARTWRVETAKKGSDAKEARRLEWKANARIDPNDLDTLIDTLNRAARGELDNRALTAVSRALEIRKETGIRESLNEPLTAEEQVEMRQFVLDAAETVVCDNCKPKVLELVLGTIKEVPNDGSSRVGTQSQEGERDSASRGGSRPAVDSTPA